MNKAFQKYPLLQSKIVAKEIAAILEGATKRDIVNLNAGLCLIEPNLSKPPKLLLECAKFLDGYKSYKNGLFKDSLSSDTHKFIETIEFDTNTAVFTAINDSIFSLNITMFLKLMHSHRSFWRKHKLPLYILAPTASFQTVDKGPHSRNGKTKYQRITVLSQCIADIKSELIVPNNAVKGLNKKYTLFSVTPKPEMQSDINLKLFDYMLKFLFINKSRTLKHSMKYTAANASQDFEKSTLYDFKTPDGYLRDRRVDKISPEEFLMIFKQWEGWPCVRNGLTRDFNE